MGKEVGRDIVRMLTSSSGEVEFKLLKPELAWYVDEGKSFFSRSSMKFSVR